MSWGDDRSKAEEGIQQAGQTMYERGKMTPEESAQYSGSFKTGDLLNQLYLYRAGLGPKPAGYTEPSEEELFGQGPLASTLYQSALAGAKDPYSAYISSLGPQLQLAQDTINRQASQRGLLQSGIPIEQMGRAGVDLAIKDAQARMQARSEELARAAGVYDVTQQQGAARRAETQGLYQTQQQAGLSAMQRQANQAQQAASYQAYPYQAQLGDYYGRQSAMYALPGQALSAAGTALGAYYNPVGTISNLAGTYNQAAQQSPQEYYPGVQSLANQRATQQVDPTKFKLGQQLNLWEA